MARGYKTPGSGRKKGTKNKVPATLREMVLQALENRGGVKFLEAQARKRNNAPFMALLAKTMPSEQQVNLTGSVRMSDEEKARRVAEIIGSARARDAH